MINTLTVVTNDQVHLQLDIYTVNNEKASVIIVHGLGEYRARYTHVADAFNKAGYSVYIYDLRGHGDSEGKRGHTPSYKHLLEDLKMVIQFVNNNSSVPIFLYGHSMGGNIVGSLLMNESKPEIKGALITSPWLELAMKASTLKIAFGELALRIMPGISQNTNLNADYLSHDKNVAKEYREDPKVHQKITPSMFFAMRKEGKKILNNMDQIEVPVLLTHGSDDRITDHKATERAAKRAKSNVVFKLWPGMYHETHNEVEKDKVIAYYIEWLDHLL